MKKRIQWFIIAGALVLATVASCVSSGPVMTERRVEVASDGWILAGDLVVPESSHPVPAVLMLNKAAGNRTAYAELANELAVRGIASLRLDLRGHGESVNLGTFVPSVEGRVMIAPSEQDVIAAYRFLQSSEGIDSTSLAVIGGSYSGEEMMEAARINGYAQAYVALSPGSFSDKSIRSIDSTGIPWLYVVARDDQYLQEITIAVRETSKTVETIIIPGTLHATDILESHPGIAERIAVWLKSTLRSQ